MYSVYVFLLLYKCVCNCSIVFYKCKGLLFGIYFYVDIFYMYIIIVLEIRRCIRLNISTCYIKVSLGEVFVRD